MAALHPDQNGEHAIRQVVFLTRSECSHCEGYASTRLSTYDSVHQAWTEADLAVRVFSARRYGKRLDGAQREAAMIALKNNFSRREWLMVVAILLMVEAWILNVSYEFRGDQDVINYISFASTIASLLLAIVAIIYGFFQSDSHAKSSAEVSAQLQLMHGSQARLADTSESMSQHMREISRLTGILQKLGGDIEATSLKLDSVGGEIAQINQQQRMILDLQQTKKPLTVGAPAPSYNPDQLVSDLFNRTSFQIDLIGVGFVAAIDLAGSNEIAMWPSIQKIAKALADDSLVHHGEEVWFALASQTAFFMRAAKLVSLTIDHNNSANSKIQFTEETVRALRREAETAGRTTHLRKELERLRAAFAPAT